MGSIEQVFVRYTPGAFEFEFVVIIDVDSGVEAVGQKKAFHVVEMTLAAIDKVVAITLA